VIDHFARVGRKRLGDVLVDEKLIGKEQLHEAMAMRQRGGTPLGRILVDSGYVSEWDLAKAVATHYNLPYLDLASYQTNEDVLEGFPGDLAHREQLLPFDRFGEVLCLACAEMPAIDVLERIQEITGQQPALYVGLGSEIKRILLESVPEPDEIPDLPVATESEIQDLLIDESQKTNWERIFDMANEQVLKEND
jgi:MSHA biogenesis protein MshE